jgi:hypothetical protein
MIIYFISFIPVITVLVWLRHRVSDIIIRRAGGARAPVLAGNLLSGKPTSTSTLFLHPLHIGKCCLIASQLRHSFQALL